MVYVRRDWIASHGHSRNRSGDRFDPSPGMLLSGMEGIGFQAEIPSDTSAMEAEILSMGTVGQTGNTCFDQYDDGCCGHFCDHLVYQFFQ